MAAEVLMGGGRRSIRLNDRMTPTDSSMMTTCPALLRIGAIRSDVELLHVSVSKYAQGKRHVRA